MKEYTNDLRATAEMIGSLSLSDHSGEFISSAGIGLDDFIHPSGGFEGAVAAADSSNIMVAESGYLSVAAIRAAFVIFHDGACVTRSRSPLRIIRAGGNHGGDAFESLFRDCFGNPPDGGIGGTDPESAVPLIRDTLEYWTLMQSLDRIERNDLLLVDGALRVGHDAHAPLMTALVEKAKEKGILLAAVTKQPSLTWGEGIPVVPVVKRVAERLEVKPPWLLKVPEDILDRGVRYKQWQQGEMYVARLHERSSRVFKIELPAGVDRDYATRVLEGCALYADDGRITGYPFPLMEAHRMAVLDSDTTELIRQDLIGRLAAEGINRELFDELFGDLHKDFTM